MIKILFIGFVALAFTLNSCGGSAGDSEDKEGEDKKSTVNKQSNSQPSSGLKIAFVYMDSINIQYKLIPIIENEIALKEKEIQANLESLQRRAMKWEKDWQTKGGPMSNEQDKYMKEMQDWQTKIGQAQQSAQLTLSQIQNEKMMQAQKRMSFIMQEYANEMGYDFIITYQLGGQVYAVNPAYNVTSDIIERLNKDVDSSVAQ